MDLNHSKGTIYGGKFKSEICLHQDKMSSMVLFVVWLLMLILAFKSIQEDWAIFQFAWYLLPGMAVAKSS